MFIWVLRSLRAIVAEKGSAATVRSIKFFGQIPVIDCEDKSLLQESSHLLHPIECPEIHLSPLAFLKSDAHRFEIGKERRMGRIIHHLFQLTVMPGHIDLF